MPHPGQIVGVGISIHVLREEDDLEIGKRLIEAQISIHVLREEDDDLGHVLSSYRAISIHVLREEDDWVFQVFLFAPVLFLSTSSARRTTRRNASPRFTPTDFYPRPPRGGRHDFHPSSSPAARFLSTSSARRTTAWARPGPRPG